MPELMVIFVIALIVIGPAKLPELARSLGKTLAEFKRATDDFKWKIEEESRATEEKERIAKEVAAKEAALKAAPATDAAQQAAAGEPAPPGQTVAAAAEEPAEFACPDITLVHPEPNKINYASLGIHSESAPAPTEAKSAASAPTVKDETKS